MTSDNIYTFDYENKSFSPVKSLEQGIGRIHKSHTDNTLSEG